jgi:UDP-glucose 4-epimerase
LLDDGARVTVLDDLSAGRRENLPDHARLKLVCDDIRSLPAVQAAMEGVTHVLHLAAQVSVRASIDDPPASCSHNVLGFVNVLEAARGRGVKRVAFASSAAVYGVPSRLPLDEDAPLAPISPYGLEKRIDELYGTLYSELFGLSTVALRYFNVYGPRQDPTSQYAGVISKFASLIKAGNPLTVFGDGGQTRDFVYVKDVARCNLLALKSDRQGPCNVGTGRSVSLLQLIEALAECAGRRPQVAFAAPVTGDIRESAMKPERLSAWLGQVPRTTLAEGLATLV